MLLVSVIIPVKNGASTLAKSLYEITRQTIAQHLEVIILDSASEDNSVSIADSFGARVISVNPKEFDHGLTRNLGVREAKGKLLYFSVQDAYLSDNSQLERMAAHFTDKEVAAVVGIQGIPADRDKNPAKWFKRFTEPVTEYRQFAKGEFTEMGLDKQFSFSSWDNVNAMYTKEALEKVPFRKTTFAEDWLWVKDALTEGLKVANDPSLLVYHYHHRTFTYSFKVQFIVNYNFYKHFEVFPSLPPIIHPFMSAVYTIFKRRQLSVKDKIYWVFHNLSTIIANFSSHLTFILIGKIFGEVGLDKLYARIFGKSIPQGRSKAPLKKQAKCWCKV